jgi:sugar O-acyltransferase (sialic acid O-acetyltransferase NeuD family)
MFKTADMEKKSIIIIGSGTISYAIAYFLKESGYKIIGFTDIIPPKSHVSGFHLNHIGDDNEIRNFKKEDVELVLALSDTHFRKKAMIYRDFKDLGYMFKTVVFSDVYLDNSVDIGEASTIFTNSSIGSFVKIGKFTQIGPNVTITHDCMVGENCYFAPSVTLAASVIIGDNVLIGTGANILATVPVGNNCKIGAGSLLSKSTGDDELWYGSPAKFIRKLT